jgi:hypothetical protein
VADVQLHGRTVTDTAGESWFYPDTCRTTHSTRLTRGHARAPVVARVWFGRAAIASGGERICLHAECDGGPEGPAKRTWDVPQHEVSTPDLARRLGPGPAVALVCRRTEVIGLIREAMTWADRTAAEFLLTRQS